ncbi:sigma 54-interacting transcriptional regulator [soil metagenome]
MDRQAFQERFGIYGNSAAIRSVTERVRQVASTGIAVLLEGESGVGKELVATAVHELSDRRHKSLVVVNCGAIPEGLIESELFGAEKGAYTGSTSQRQGYFEEANNGTLFLDEIGEMPLQSQVRLLRVLESGQYSRVGSSQTNRTDARIVAATNKNLAQEVSAGRFREDLYYRLSTVVLRIPPLRERSEDVILLMERFLYQFAQRYNAPVRRFEPDARELLLRYAWPGNVRELRNVAEQIVVLLRNETVSVDELRPLLRGVSAGGGALVAARPEDATGAHQDLLYKAMLEMRLEMSELKDLVRQLAGALALNAGASLPGSASVNSAPLMHEVDVSGLLEDDFDFDGEATDLSEFNSVVEDVAFEVETTEGDGGNFGPFSPMQDDIYLAGVVSEVGTLPTLEEAERMLIGEALRRFDGNRRQTAEALGMSERTLYRKIKELEAAGVEE